MSEYLLSDEEWVVLEKLAEARQAKREWEEEEKRCRSALLDAVGDAATLIYGGNIVGTVTDKTSSRFDRKTFAQDWPKLDEEYRTESKSKVVNPIVTGPVEEA